MAQGEVDVVEALDQARSGMRVEREALLEADRRRAHDPGLDIDRDLERRIALDGTHEPGDRGLRQLDRYDAVLHRVRAKDVGELRRDDRGESRLLERPRRVLARGSAAEVRAGDEDARARVARVVQ